MIARDSVVAIIERNESSQQSNVLDSDVPRIYREAKVSPLLSEYNGSGIPLLNVFVAGCPVVVGRACSFPEVGGDASEYFDLKSTDEISHSLGRVIISCSRVDELGGAEGLGLFPWSCTVEQTADWYLRLA